MFADKAAEFVDEKLVSLGDRGKEPKVDTPRHAGFVGCKRESMGRGGEEGCGTKDSRGAQACEGDILSIVASLEDADPTVCKEITGLIILSLLDERITFEQWDGFHLAKEVDQEFFGQIAKESERGLGDRGGEFDAFEVADQLESEGDLRGGIVWDLELSGGQFGVPRRGLFGRIGQEVTHDRLEDLALLFVVEMEAKDQQAVEKVTFGCCEKSNSFPSGLGLGVFAFLERDSEGRAIFERGWVFGDSLHGVNEGDGCRFDV